MGTVAVLLFAVVNLTPATAEGVHWCETEEGQQDPRCSPDYCNDRQNAEDPYCWDPDFCKNYPDDPICGKGQVEPKKQTCVWYVDGAPVNSVVPVIRGANPGPHLVRLDCPNHQLASWECREKARDGTIIPSTGMKEPVCTYHGATATVGSCAATFAWTVMVPDFNTWTVELTATTFKVEETKDPATGLVSCAGPVDWNTTEWVVGDDGTLQRHCVLENEFLAKDSLFKSDGKWHHYSWNEDGTVDYHTHPNLVSMPDGKIDECDFQTYGIQWRQFN